MKAAKAYLVLKKMDMFEFKAYSAFEKLADWLDLVIPIDTVSSFSEKLNYKFMMSRTFVL